PVPVRYPAAATLGGRLYVFGGQAVGGPADGQAVDVIQVVDPVTRIAREVGRLPEAVAGAAAAVIDGHLYLAGGTSAPAGSTASGVAVRDIWAFDTSTNTA